MTAKKKAAARRAAPKSPATRAAYGEIQQGIKHLEKSIAEIQKGLRHAERQIETEAKRRVRDLRKEGKAQLAALKGKQREAAAKLKQVSAAAEDSWEEVKRSADAILADARDTATNVVDRIRAALQR